ncbi:MAG TPA: type II toxin-antitoxin system VapC family toxin [Rhodanobacteraceae bacterium]|nr:type II toxin-antitoxin system VapC family toxin [Rhodanobacteraceae bacterium]
MPYLDTSLLVAALTRETRTASVQRWLAGQPAESLVISDWTTTEFSAALSMKVRMKHLDEATRADVLAAFTALARETFTVLSVARPDFRAAARFADQHGSGLRAGDALHLGIVANHGEQLLSLDRVQVKAAVAAGISARLF